MAPLTRNRALPGRIPGDLQVEYYRQRASAGLIVTEASQICAQGQGYLDTPGIYSPEQVAGWRRVTDAVHAAGGRMMVSPNCNPAVIAQARQRGLFAAPGVGVPK